MPTVGPGKTQVGIVLTEETATWLRIEAAKTRKKLGEVVEETIRAWREAK